MMASWVEPGEPKPVVYVGTHTLVRPDGKVEMRPYFRGLGAGNEEYPHDADSGD